VLRVNLRRRYPEAYETFEKELDDCATYAVYVEYFCYITRNRDI
jgi:hypothetical protein